MVPCWLFPVVMALNFVLRAALRASFRNEVFGVFVPGERDLFFHRDIFMLQHTLDLIKAGFIQLKHNGGDPARRIEDNRVIFCAL